MASCAIIKDQETGKLVKVMAPNGRPSLLFQGALNALGDEQLALRAWARAYTTPFKLRFGDWQNEPGNLKLDDNGEPSLSTVMNLQTGVNRIIESEYSHWYSFQPGKEKWTELKYVEAFMKQIAKKYPDLKFTVKTDPLRPGMGLPVLVPTVKPINNNYTKAEIEKQKVPVNKFMNKLISKFPGLTYEWITPSQLKQNEHQRSISGIRSFVKNNKIYLVEGRVMPEDGIEEVMHVFVEMLRQSKPNLFKGIFENTHADEKYAAEYELIKNWYKDEDGNFNDIEVKSEFLAKVMGRGMKSELMNNPEGRPTSAFGKLLQRFLDWLASVLDTGTIRPGQAIKDIIGYINTEDLIIPLPEDSYMYYSIDPPADSNFDPDSKDDAAKMNPRFKGKTGRELNIEKITEGLETLKTLKGVVTSMGARNVIDILIKNNEELITALENGDEYVSTTIYKGSQDTESSKSKATELGASTGNFFHDLMEKVQIDSILQKRSAIDVFFDENYFEDYFKEHKSYILFDKYDPKILKSMGAQVATLIQSLNNEGKIALPETTIGVKDVDGTLVLGRLDIMAVDRNGTVEIVDLKTKLNKGPATGIFPEQLFNRPFDFRGDYKDGVASEFMEFRNKSDLDNFHIQLAIYSEMIKKLGIKVNENGHQIFALAFSSIVSPDGTKFELNGFNVKKYSYPNLLSNNNTKMFTAINNAAAYRFDPILRAKSIEEEVEETITAKENPFSVLSDNAKNDLILKLTALAEEQLESLKKEITKLDENEEMDEDKKKDMRYRLVRQSNSILQVKLKLKNIFASTESFSEDTISMSKALIIKLALDTFQKEIDNISERIKSIDIPETFDLKNLQDTYALKELQQNTESLDNISEYLNLFMGTIRTMNIDEETKSNITAYLSKAISKADDISNAYVSVGKKVMKAILMESIGTKKFENVFGEMKKVLQPELDWVNKMIAKIEKGDAPTDTLFSKAGRLINGFFSTVKSNKDRLQMLKEKKAEIESLIKVNKLDDETLDAYLEGIINNPDSTFYMGSTMSGNNPLISMDAIIGSNANSEMAINGLFQYMRNTLEEAKNEARNWAYETDVDGKIKNFVSAMGGSNEANKAISEEVVSHEKFDKDGNVTKEQTQRQLLNPVLQEHENTHNRYKGQMREIGNQISELHTRINEESNAALKENLVNQRAELYDQLHKLENEFTEWQIETTETQIKPEVYRLMKGSGKHNSQITDLYSTINEIINEAGGEEMLTDADQDVIDELEAQVSRIREEQLAEDPESAKNFDELMKFFDYDLNINLWTIKREDVVKEGSPTKLERFDKNNTDTVATQEWQDTVSDLFDKLSRIVGEDAELKEINKEINSIKRKNKVRGKFNYKYMTDSDITAYTELIKKRDQRLEELKENSADLTEDQQEQIQLVYDTLGSIRKRELNEDYKKQLDRLKAKVLNKYELYKEAEKAYKNATSATVELSNAVEAARSQYERSEDEFAAFFNKHNDNKYNLGEDIIAKKKSLKERPKAYLFEYVPTNEKYLEKVPNKKYRIRRLKAEAYNPNYQQSFVKDKFGRGMLPMPKGIRFNAETKTFDVDPKSKYANPDFLKMQNNSAAHEFYKTFVVENFLMKQKSASGISLGFCYPFSEQRLGDNIITKGAEGIAREVKEKIQEMAYKNSDYEKASNESGMMGENKIRFKENSRMPADLTTTNGIQALLEWNYGYYANKAMAKTGVQMDSTLYYLNNIRDRLSDLKDESKTEKLNKIDTIIKIAEFEKRKFVYGQRYEKEKNPNAFFNRKTMRMMMQLAAAGRMAFDIPMQFGNLLSGNVQAFLSTSVSRHADEFDYLNAKKLVYTRWFPSMIADWGKISNISLETMIFRYMNPAGKDFTEELDGASTSRARKLFARGIDIQDMSMALQDKGETEISLTTMLMIMVNTKYEVFETNADGNPIIEDGVKKIKKDADGNTVYVNAVEAFAKKDGKLVMRPDVNISQKDINDLKGTIMTELYTFQGNYSAYTQTQFGSTLFGSLYNFYRKYLIPSLSARFAYGGYKGVGSAYSWDTEKTHMGWYAGLFKMIKYYGLGKASKTLLYDALLPGFVKKSFKYNDEEMSSEGAQYYRSRAAMAAREVLFGYLCLQLYWTLRASLKDNDEDDLSYAELMLMRSLVKMTNETRSLIPVPVWGKPEDYIDTFSSYTSAFKEGKTIWGISKHSFWYFNYELTGSERAYDLGFYQKDTDRFEEGSPKLFKDFSDISGVSNIVDVWSPYEAAKRSLKSKE